MAESVIAQEQPSQPEKPARAAVPSIAIEITHLYGDTDGTAAEYEQDRVEVRSAHDRRLAYR